MTPRLLALSPALLGFSLACATTPAPAPEAPPLAEETPVEEEAVAPVDHGPVTIDVFTAPEAAGAVNSYLVSNHHELIVVDGQLVVPAAEALVEQIKATGKTPKAFFLTHAHPDHYFGFQVLQQAFPEVPLYATAGVKAEFDAAAQPTLEAMKGMLGEAAPAGVATVTLLEGPLTLGDETLEVTELAGGEHAVSAIVRIPSQKALLAGDHLYQGVHLWMKDCDSKTWLSHLEAFQQSEPGTVFYPGHGAGSGGVELIEANIAYLEGYRAEIAKARGKTDAARLADAKKRVLEKFPTYQAPQFVDWTLADQLACAKADKKKGKVTKRPSKK